MDTVQFLAGVGSLVPGDAELRVERFGADGADMGLLVGVGPLVCSGVAFLAKLLHGSMQTAFPSARACLRHSSRYTSSVTALAGSSAPPLVDSVHHLVFQLAPQFEPSPAASTSTGEEKRGGEPVVGVVRTSTDHVDIRSYS